MNVVLHCTVCACYCYSEVILRQIQDLRVRFWHICRFQWNSCRSTRNAVSPSIQFTISWFTCTALHGQIKGTTNCFYCLGLYLSSCHVCVIWSTVLTLGVSITSQLHDISCPLFSPTILRRPPPYTGQRTEWHSISLVWPWNSTGDLCWHIGKYSNTTSCTWPWCPTAGIAYKMA